MNQIINLADSKSIKSEVKITGSTAGDNTKDLEIIVPLKYLSNFWRTLEMLLINCEVSLHMNLCYYSFYRRRKIYNNWYKNFVLVVTLSTFVLDNWKLLQQSGFRRTINWNKYQSDPKTYAQNRYLNHLVNPSFQGVNTLFVLSFENENDRTSH